MADIIRIEVDDAGVFEEELAEYKKAQDEHDRLVYELSRDGLDRDIVKHKRLRLMILGGQIETAGLYIAQMVKRVVVGK